MENLKPISGEGPPFELKETNSHSNVLKIESVTFNPRKCCE